MEVVVRDAPQVIGATGMESIEQNIRNIVRTLAYSVPLDRGFADGAGFIDSPSPVKTARLIAALTLAIEKYEPKVKVEQISLQPGSTDEGMQGVYYPKISFHLREGVTL